MMRLIEVIISNAQVSESNYGHEYATESDIKRRKKSIETIGAGFETFKLAKQDFEKSLADIQRKLNDE